MYLKDPKHKILKKKKKYKTKNVQKNSKILKKLSDKLSVPDQWNSFDLLPRECKFSENSVSKKCII